MSTELSAILATAFAARAAYVDPAHQAAFRLFNGFREGYPAVVLDVYGTTLVIHDHADAECGDEATVRDAAESARNAFPWLTTALWKVRAAGDRERRNGTLLWGDATALARRVREDGVWYALNLRLNRDASLYLDTRGLRTWARQTLGGKRVLNTFAYTGSLGVAARAGGAAEVVHTDLNRAFLSLAKDSYAMNGWPTVRRDFRPGDFFDVVGELKREARLFDCVLVDPPLFSVTRKGRVDLADDNRRVLDKVRPLIAHGGTLVAVNNAVFVSGAQFQASLEALCADGYLTFDHRLDVPADCTGPASGAGALPVDCAPFNHSTKIAVLQVVRKDGRV